MKEMKNDTVLEKRLDFCMGIFLGTNINTGEQRVDSFTYFNLVVPNYLGKILPSFLFIHPDLVIKSVVWITYIPYWNA